MDKPKFNIIDGLIILVLILAIAVGGYLFLGRQSDGASSAGGSVAEYKVHLLKSEMHLADLFMSAQKNGEKVFASEKERVEAIITDVFVEPARKLTTDIVKGEAKWAEIPELYDITVTLQSKVSESDAQITLGNTPLRVGEEIAVKGKGFGGYGFIVGLKLVD